MSAESRGVVGGGIAGRTETGAGASAGRDVLADYPARIQAVSPGGVGLLTAMQLANLARNCGCLVRIGHGSQWAEATDILGLVSLAAGAGATITIEARGSGAGGAVITMAWMVADGIRPVARPEGSVEGGGKNGSI